MTKDSRNPSKWTRSEREDDPQGYAAAQVARSQDETQAQVDQTVAAKKEAFISRYVDRANGEQEWENLLARRGVGR